MLASEPPLVVAHRGDARRHRENTLPAFEAAVEAGADAIEFDVQLSGDGVPVVLHDPTGLPAAELHLRGVPRLEAVLARLVGRLPLDVEVKGRGEIVPSVRELLVPHARRGDVLVSSFEPSTLEALTDLPRALLVEEVPPAATLRALLRDLSPLFVGPDAARLDGAALRLLLDEGVAVVPWTVNDREAMRRWVTAGVTGFFTDELAVAVPLRNRPPTP